MYSSSMVPLLQRHAACAHHQAHSHAHHPLCRETPFTACAARSGIDSPDVATGLYLSLLHCNSGPRNSSPCTLHARPLKTRHQCHRHETCKNPQAHGAHLCSPHSPPVFRTICQCCSSLTLVQTSFVKCSTPTQLGWPRTAPATQLGWPLKLACVRRLRAGRWRSLPWFVAQGDAPLSEVVWAELHGHLVSDHDLDAVLPNLAGQVC